MVDQISADRAGSIRKMVDDGLADAELAALLCCLLYTSDAADE